eukprot:gnl/Dysnectes_brevis/1556_a1766_2388.p1 GENE.gnl/Dysnectes_brevis/1556_a1766_2388~~gnl/Dysnectes_brevis/1556_a1766_2388.p1  ORF type:complete len:300 (-),score=134.67 gnl/Dysnectes_brevis/1556_a1766_2388:71-970(-)
MVKFDEFLEEATSLHPETARYYVDYGMFKQYIALISKRILPATFEEKWAKKFDATLVAEASTPTVRSPLRRLFETLEDIEQQPELSKFFLFLDAEVEKVNAFFTERFAFLDAQFLELRANRYERCAESLRIEKQADMDETIDAYAVTGGHISEYHQAWRDLYNQLNHLRDYSKVCFLGFVKGLKKSDKNLRIPIQEDYCEWIEETQPFQVRMRDLSHLRQEVELVYACLFHQSNLERAKKELKIYSEGPDSVKKSESAPGFKGMEGAVRAINWSLAHQSRLAPKYQEFFTEEVGAIDSI